jgi:hypothetical protein
MPTNAKYFGRATKKKQAQKRLKNAINATAILLNLRHEFFD